MNDVGPNYKKSKFSVPENYFDGFEDKVMNRIHAENKEKPIKITPFRNLYWGIAASILLAGFTFLLFKTDNRFQNMAKVSETEPDAIELIAFENSIEVSEEEFEEIIPDAFIDSVYTAEMEIVSHDPAIQEEKALIELEDEYTPLDIENDI